MGITKLALERLDGVYYSTVSMARGEAIVLYDSQLVSPEEMVSVYHDDGTGIMMTHYCGLRNLHHPDSHQILCCSPRNSVPDEV